MSRSAVSLVLAASLLLFTTGSGAAPADPPAPGDPKDPKKGGIDRTKATKKRLLKEFGGSEESEEAVMLGLAWLTQMQKKDGHWAYEAGHHAHDHAAATGMAVLAFLGAGQSHKEGRYKQTVQAGLDWLVKNVDLSQGGNRGKFNTATTMYSQGIATLALCEAYGMTQDPALKEAAQAAIDYIQKAQGNNGSWGYTAGTENDTSIVGWQIQALHAAKLSQGLVVDDRVLKKAIGFLNFVSAGQNKAVYGYNTSGNARPGTSLTAIGLLCRYYIDGWRAETAGFAEGTKGLMKHAPSAQPRPHFDLYYYYYATQVVRFHGGDVWKTWNEGRAEADGTRRGGMADWLIELQVRKGVERGSWDPERSAGGQPAWIGQNCGRLGTTCLCLLTLEVYYRYTPEGNQVEPKKP